MVKRGEAGSNDSSKVKKLKKETRVLRTKTLGKILLLSWYPSFLLTVSFPVVSHPYFHHVTYKHQLHDTQNEASFQRLQLATPSFVRPLVSRSLGDFLVFESIKLISGQVGKQLQQKCFFSRTNPSATL